MSPTRRDSSFVSTLVQSRLSLQVGTVVDAMPAGCYAHICTYYRAFGEYVYDAMLYDA